MGSSILRHESNSFRVLALDGGGIRGLYTATLLKELDGYFVQDVEGSIKNLGSRFDLITGTGTGGILACGLAGGVPVERIIDLYERHGPLIFKDPKPSGRVSLFLWLCRHSFGAANKAAALRKGLEEIFGDATLASFFGANRVALCIPSIKMLNQRPKVFKTPHAPHLRIDGRYRVVDICLATSAAPVLLPLAVD